MLTVCKAIAKLALSKRRTRRRQITFTDKEWATIANALRVCATLNDKEPADNGLGDHWQQQAKTERALAERIESEQGV